MAVKADLFIVFYYLRLLLRHRLLIIISFCIAIAIGMYLAITMPRIYEAGTLILVVPQRVPSDYVRSVVTTDIQARISTISEQILSRSNLEKIIDKFGLFSASKYRNMFLDDKLENLRRRIEINVRGSRSRSRKESTFSVTFRGSDPLTVMNVTNTLAGSFIEENLRLREEQATGTSAFLNDELQVMRSRLEEVEEKLREYRRQYMGELPEQLNANLSMLGRLQEQLNAKEIRLRDEKNRLVGLEGQIEASRRSLTLSSGTGSVSENGDAMSLEQLKAQLASLKTSYTDRHPDVLRLKAQIANLEARYNSGELAATDGSRPDNSNDRTAGFVSRNESELMRRRSAAIGEIKNTALAIEDLNQKIKEYQERVERTPKREQELLTLNRDYRNIQESYNSLLNRKLEAEISVNMEKKQKGEQFRIIDRAVLPIKPVSPNVKRLFLMSALAGLGLGAGFIFLLDLLNTSIKQPKDYESILGLNVLATIPKMDNHKDIMLRRVNWGLTAVSLAIATALTAAFGLMIFKGVDPVINIASQYIKI
jgi:polysaccharide chain length determinant protein (PEP-CTERM system associated)